MPKTDPITALKGLGLTGLEAEIYVHLLMASPSTGYSVAKGLRKPAANVYKALDTLAAKGAIEIEEGKTRQVRPVPYHELLEHLSVGFNRLREEAAASLATLPGPEYDHRIYHLHTLDQVMVKCGSMLDSATSVVLADVFPESAELLRPALEASITRGVRVALRCYAPFTLDGAEVQQAQRGARILARWPVQWMNLVVDGQQSIVTVFHNGGGEVIQSFFTSSPALAYVHHSGLIAEIGYSAVRHVLESERPSDRMREAIGAVDAFRGETVPGLDRLIGDLGLRDHEGNAHGDLRRS